MDGSSVDGQSADGSSRTRRRPPRRQKKVEIVISLWNHGTQYEYGLARKKIRRVYCGRTFNHYYYNTVYGTTSWKKPYCLRGTDLHPHLTPDEAAARIQGMHRGWVARLRTIREIKSQYKKIFHRHRGVFYYAFNGPSNLLPRQSYLKPLLLGCRGYPDDIKPVMTDDVYAIRIQRKWRVCLEWKFLQTLVRKIIRRDWDPVEGRFVYTNRNNATSSFDKPKLLHREPWDPNYVPGWDVSNVILFIRRLGLKQYTSLIEKYAIDGNTLLLLTESDFTLLGVSTTIHSKKILLALEAIHPSRTRNKAGAAYQLRVEKIRKHGAFDEASISVQRVYRGYLGRKYAAYLKESRRLFALAKARNNAVEVSSEWYTDQMMRADRTGAMFQKHIKDFGRFADHMTVQGWGRYDTSGWCPVAVVEDGNPTRKFTERLASSGYDSRREKLFLDERGRIEQRALLIHK